MVVTPLKQSLEKKGGGGFCNTSKQNCKKHPLVCSFFLLDFLCNVKVAITIGGAITCQAAVIENFVGSYFFSFFRVLHLVLVIGFPWLSLDIVCWPKFNAGFHFHICYRDVQESVILASKLYLVF